jgi:predicted nucleotide-binding protein
MGSVPMDWREPTSYTGNKKNIFVVHGRDDLARLTITDILHSFELKPIILNDQANEGMTLIEKFEKYASSTKYAVVLLTADDLGGRNSKNLRYRARQNVILELGFFMGSLGRDRVCCVYKKGVELPSDIKGIVYVPYDQSVNECYRRIETELMNAGYLQSR